MPADPIARVANPIDEVGPSPPRPSTKTVSSVSTLANETYPVVSIGSAGYVLSIHWLTLSMLACACVSISALSLLSQTLYSASFSICLPSKSAVIFSRILSTASAASAISALACVALSLFDACWRCYQVSPFFRSHS